MWYRFSRTSAREGFVDEETPELAIAVRDATAVAASEHS